MQAHGADFFAQYHESCGEPDCGHCLRVLDVCHPASIAITYSFERQCLIVYCEQCGTINTILAIADRSREVGTPQPELWRRAPTNGHLVN